MLGETALRLIRWRRRTSWISWSTGRELTPRILVLQTSALATSPPVLISLCGQPRSSKAALRVYLLCLAGKIFLCQVPRFYRQAGSTAVGALARVFHGNRGRDDDRFTNLPVSRHRDPVAVDRLQRFENTDQLVHIAPQLHRVVNNGADVLLGIDREDSPYRGCIRSRLMHQSI